MEITQFPREITGEWLAKPYQNAEVPGTVIRSGTVLLQAPYIERSVKRLAKTSLSL